MPKGPQGQKRPADVIGNAVRATQIATGEVDETAPIGWQGSWREGFGLQRSPAKNFPRSLPLKSYNNSKYSNH